MGGFVLLLFCGGFEEGEEGWAWVDMYSWWKRLFYSIAMVTGWSIGVMGLDHIQSRRRRLARALGISLCLLRSTPPS